MRLRTSEAKARGLDILKLQSASDISFVGKLPIKDGMRILDVGCFKGRDLRWIAKNFPNCDLYGIDKYQECIDYCIREQADINVKWAVCDATDLPFSGKIFDIVFSNGVLNDVEEKEAKAILKEMNRIGKQVYNGVS